MWSSNKVAAAAVVCQNRRSLTYPRRFVCFECFGFFQVLALFPFFALLNLLPIEPPLTKS